MDSEQVIDSARPDRPALVRRTRLVERLVGSRDTPVVLIGAPAGFGKSTVLGEWSEADPRPFATLILERRHDDPVLLAASIAGAVAEHAHVDEGVYSALRGSRAGTVGVAVPRLLESMRSADASVVLALDDVHALSDPESLRIVTALADGLPEGSQLALASRTNPSIRVSRLRANRALTELTARDLAMTATEADDLLRASGLELREESVELLVERTEGWPAALHLAALSLHLAEDADQAARDFAGDDRMVADYLRDELISSLREVELQFLTRTSILDEVSGDLCDAVLATEGSGTILRELARGNALVTALDSKDQVFRYHALLREMLASELHALHPREEAGLHARAGHWYAERGDFDRAVPHSIASGDVDVAARLIWSLADEYASAGRGTTLRNWLAEFPDGQRQASAPLCLAAATGYLTEGDGAEVEHWVSAAFTALRDGSTEDAAELEVAARLIRATSVPRAGVTEMGDGIGEIASLVEGGWASLACLVQGVAKHLTGDRDGAGSHLEEGVRRGLSAAPTVEALCRAQLALLALDEGDFEAASEASDHASETIDRFGLGDNPTQALVVATVALTRARAGRTREAAAGARHAEELLAKLREFAPWYMAEVQIVLARALLLLDDVGGARAHLAHAGAPLHRIPDAVVLKEWFQRAWDDADAARAVTGRWPLTPAELRLLHELPTHLTFREIADELFVSANTVKTQARSIYRKLGASGRAEAVAVAKSAGLLRGTE